MKREQATANIVVGKEICIQSFELATILGSLEVGFSEGITGEEVEEHLIKTLETISQITKSSYKTLVMKNNETDEVSKVDVNIISIETLARMGMSVIGFLEIFPYVYENETDEEVADFIESFFKEMAEGLNNINDELDDVFNKSKEVLEQK